MALYKDLSNTVSDKYYTQPLPQIAIPIKNPVNAGPTYSGKDYSKGPFIQNFNIPGYYSTSPITMVNNNGINVAAPKNEILYRYGYELQNLNNGKVAGGFDKYNVKNIPSSTQRTGNYMVFSVANDPFSLLLASEPDRDKWYYDSHSS